MMLGRGVFVSTWRALVEPRRLVPILLVCVPLVAAQGSFSRDPLAVPLAIVLCLTFVLLAPWSYRALFLNEAPPSAANVLLYVGLAIGSVGALGLGAPRVLGMGKTFLTSTVSVGVSMALFMVGGWGLARDIDLESRLERERARVEAFAREAERAQLLAVRSNLDPHFLFNTLNAIAEWCREDGVVAEQAILKLSAMLRAVLEGVRTPTWPLEREVELVRALFDLHAVRSPSAFTLAWNVDARAFGAPILPLLLLPLAENAMKHGPSAGFGGEVAFAVTVGAHVLDVTIENPGAYAGPREGSAGIPTVERRLVFAYGDASLLRIGGVEGNRTRVTVTLPLSGPRTEVNV
jgi:two-component system sensor histidine kinase AlgZ